MIFYGDVSYHMNKGRFWKKHMQELLGDTTEVELLQERYFAHGSGGLFYIMM